MAENQSGKKPPTESEETDRAVGAGVGGALLGASLGGPPGAIIGGLIGLFLAAAVNEDKRKSKDKNQKHGGKR